MATNIAQTMKAAMVVQHGSPLEIRDVPVPQPGPGEVLIKIEMTGVCHTDLHVKEGDWSVKCPIPMTPGHEGVGRVVMLGQGVTNLHIGDCVCTPWIISSCQNCESCITGWETTCGNQKNCGFTVHGSFAEYIVASAAYVGVIPKNLSMEQAAPITCAGVTVYKGLKVSKVTAGNWMVIVGACGGLGHVAIQYAKAMGMKVIGVDASENCIEFMNSLGCDHSINARTTDVTKEVKSVTGGGAHGSLMIVPSQRCVHEATMYLRARGVLVLLALPPGDFSCSTLDVVLKALRVEGSIVGTRQDLKEALQFASDGKVKCHVEVRPFDQVNTIMDDLKNGNIKGRVVMKMP